MNNRDDVGSTPTFTAKIRCKFCEKEFSKMGLPSHVWRTHGEGKSFKPTKGKRSWNSGLTKFSDERVAKYGNTLSDRIISGDVKQWQLGLSKETDARLKMKAEKTSDKVTKKVIAGEWHLSFSKTRTFDYNGIKLRGTWEVLFAKYLDENQILWEQPIQAFPYEFENKIHHYFPDFYLVNEKIFVEIKGYETPKDRAKWKFFPENLLVLKGKDLVSLGLNIIYKDV